MTKNEIAETVLLRISGGRLSADIDVRREDIFPLVSPAISMAIDRLIAQGMANDMRRIRITGSPGPVNFGYGATYTLTPELDTARGIYKIALPGRLFILPENQGIQMVAPVKGRDTYIKVSGRWEIVGIADNLGVTFYWHEVVNCKSVIFLEGLGQPVCDHLVKMMIDPSQTSVDEELALPAGADLAAIDLLVAHFSGQRLMPQDVIMDATQDQIQRQ